LTAIKIGQEWTARDQDGNARRDERRDAEDDERERSPPHSAAPCACFTDSGVHDFGLKTYMRPSGAIHANRFVQ
jgi:hypothetical protein